MHRFEADSAQRKAQSESAKWRWKSAANRVSARTAQPLRHITIPWNMGPRRSTACGVCAIIPDQCGETVPYTKLPSRAEGNRRRLGGERRNLDGIAHVLEAFDQAACVGRLGAPTEVVCAEVLIEGSVREHMVDGGEHGGRDSADGFLRTAAAAQAQVLGLIVASAFVFGGVGALDESFLSQRPPWRSRFDRRLPALSCCAGKGEPTTPDAQRWRSNSINANLGDDGFGAELVDAGVAAHNVNGGAKGREIGLDFAVERGE